MQQSNQWLNQKPATTSKLLYTSYYGRLQKIDDIDSSDRIMLNQNDIVLCMFNPTYKAVMFDQFQKLDPARDSEKESNVSKQLFKMFKDRGGRFFKANQCASRCHTSIKCYEVNEKVALESKFTVTKLLVIDLLLVIRDFENFLQFAR